MNLIKLYSSRKKSQPMCVFCNYFVNCFHLIAFGAYCSYRRGNRHKQHEQQLRRIDNQKGPRRQHDHQTCRKKTWDQRQYVNRPKKQCLAKGIKVFDHGNKGKDRVWKAGPGTTRQKSSSCTAGSIPGSALGTTTRSLPRPKVN